MRKRTSTYRLTSLSLMLTLSLILGYVESLIPVIPTLPGIKLGLPNLLVLLLLWKRQKGWLDALLVNLLRIVLSAILFGSAISFIYAITAGLISLSAMVLFGKTEKIGIHGVSIIGAVIHNCIQLCVAYFLTGTKQVFLYLPVLLIAGSLCGIVNGIIAYYIQPYFHKFMDKER